MQNQNLFALLPYDAEDVSYTAAPVKAPAADEKKKHPNDKTNKSKPDNNKTGYQDAHYRSNGYHQSKYENWGNNRVADGSGSNYNANYKGSSYQKNYNGEQRLHGVGRGGGGYGGRGRSFNEYSNGKQLGNPIKGNQSGEAESLNKPVTGDGKEAWQVVGAPSRASSVVSEGRSEVSYNPDQNGPYSKGNGDDSNPNATGNLSPEEEERRIRWEQRMKEREEERKKKTLKQYYEEKEKTEKEKKEKEKVVPKQQRVVALDKELEAMQLVGKKALPLRKQESDSVSVTDVKSDKNKEKKGSDSVSVTDVKSDKNKEKEDSEKKEKVCKSIVEELLKPSRYQPQRYNPNPYGNASNGFSDKGAPVKGNPSDKGFKESHLEGKGKDTTAEGSNRKGNAAIVVRSDNREAVERKVVKSAVNVDLKFDDTAQFPALK